LTRCGLRSQLMFDVGMLAIAAACFACIFAIFRGLEKI
jgi:hypothetical protein